MRPAFFVPYIITLSIWIAPAITPAMTFYYGPRAKQIEWNNFASHSVLKQRAALDSLKGYTPRLNLSANGALGLYGTEAQGHVMLYLPWVTIVGASDLESLKKPEGEINLIIGDFNRFPAYLQLGLLDGMVGRHASELLLMPSLTTRKAFCSFASDNRFALGGKIGGHYSFKDYGEVKTAVLLSAGGVVGPNIEYDIVYADIHFLVGGGAGLLVDEADEDGSFTNIYTEISGRERQFNNFVKFKFERLSAKRDKLQHSNGPWSLPSSTTKLYKALHAELSYHLPLYYFGNPSAVVVGYNALGKTISYGFGGMKVNVFRYFDLVAGITFGKVRAQSSGGVGPLLQLQLSI